MANPEHVEIVKQGAEAIDAWRRKNPEGQLELSTAKLSGANLSGANLTRANLIDANLTDANLGRANLFGGGPLFGEPPRGEPHRRNWPNPGAGRFGEGQ